MLPQATQRPDVYEFTARVTSVETDGSVELSETLFYPTGGGQPCDTGTLARDDGTVVRVIDVRKTDGQIFHVIDAPILTIGDHVRGTIDCERRNRHRRMHTAMHLVCAALERRAGTKITGNQIGAERSRLDVDLAAYDPSVIESAVAEANAQVVQDVPVERRVTTRAELAAHPALVKLAAGFPESVTAVHLVEIPGIDLQACGGTHVSRTGDISTIVVLKTENRGKNHRRVYFGLSP